jgi:hypothetical protein
MNALGLKNIPGSTSFWIQISIACTGLMVKNNQSKILPKKCPIDQKPTDEDTPTELLALEKSLFFCSAISDVGSIEY